MQKASTKFTEIDYKTYIAPALPYDYGTPQINGAAVCGAIAGNAMSVKNDPSNNYWIPQKNRTSAEDIFN